MAVALVDTSVIVDFLRNFAPAIEWRNRLGESLLGATPMVWMEMSKGAENRLDQHKALLVLRQFERVYLTAEDQDWALEQYIIFRLSHGVGIVDCLIAAPAHRLQIPFYIHNLKHFVPLLGVLVQKPYQSKD